MNHLSFPFLILAIAAGPGPAFAAVASSVVIEDDFSTGSHGWTAFFLDHPEGVEDEWEMHAGLRELPQELARPGTGFMITGNNHSDDLGMALEKRLSPDDGLVPGQTYWVDFEIDFASNAPSGAFGVGGSPGDSVYLKAGASATEPGGVLDPEDGHIRPTINVGFQSVGGPAASSAGVIANGRDAAEPAQFVALSRVHRHRFPVRAGAAGQLWLLVMTDSAFEGPTTLYYLRIRASLTPVDIGDGSGIVNLSSRARVHPGDGALIAGFVVQGEGPGSCVVRVVGPSLADHGIADPLGDPRLRLFHASDVLLMENDDWPAFPALEALRAAMAGAGAFPLRENSSDAAVVAELGAGIYTAVASGGDDIPGTGLIEIYAVPAEDRAGRLVNLSTRANIGETAGNIITGLVIGGPHPERVLLRAAGPALAAHGVANPAVDPVLTLYSGETVIATNQAWEKINAGEEIAAAAAEAGAFLFAEGSRDAALLVALAPGSYTLVVEEAEITPARTALVEVYSVP
ncbi:MAG: hypothetical protein ACREIA_11805 [Opitutaceae bacterium]